MIVELLVLIAAFGAGTGIAELAGAPNTGTAMGFGAIAFAIVVVAIILRRP